MSEGQPRAALICPGRGAYTSASLGSLPADHPLVRRAEELRSGYELEPLLSLDGADAFDPARHLRPANASPLILLATLLDAETARRDHRFVAVAGNSLGWYSALAVSGALPFDDAFRLVQELSLLQELPPPGSQEASGGQLIYPLTDADWRPSAELATIVADLLEDHEVAAAGSNGERRVYPSVDLGGYAVLAADESGIAHALERLPPLKIGARLYPVRLAQHGPYHTPLVAHVAEAARATLGELRWSAPQVTLVDGRGARWSPWSTDPGALRDYTLGDQLVTPYRFASSVQVILREYAPDLLLLPGPGNTLGGICGQIVVGEGYRGIRARGEFESAQAGRRPLILSMRR